MVIISFSVFKEKILNDTKRQTIRKSRKYLIKVGDIQNRLDVINKEK